MSTLPTRQLMEKIVSLFKRGGFICQSSEVYGGLSGVWDYGPLGVEVKRNLKNYWWRVTVHERDNVVGMDGSILTAPAVLKASGHVEGFSDPMIDCRSCKARLRADQIINKKGEKQCPVCGGKDLTEPRAFNLMFKTRVGPVDPRWSGTAIFPVSLQGATGPAGPSQPTQPSTMTAGTTIVPASGPVVSADDERAFYSKGTYDIEYDFPFGCQELEGVAYRTDYDLSQHQKASGKSLEYFDEETKQRFVPHVVEPSAGVDRTVLALICEAYSEDEAPDEKGKMETRVVLRFHPRVAPIKCAVFPLLKNKEPLVAKAKEIVDLLRPHMYVFYDESGAIGRRYRRQDEIGTPFGVTVDFETLGEKDATLRNTVTLRDRDSMKQRRVAIGELAGTLLADIT